MSGRPDWVDSIPGFDPARWWVPVVCTHGVSGLSIADVIAEAEVIGVAYDDGSRVRLQRSPNREYIGLTQGLNRGPMTRGRARVAVDRTARTAGQPGRSINLHCPAPACFRNPRIPGDRWEQILDDARRADACVIDLASLG